MDRYGRYESPQAIQHHERDYMHSALPQGHAILSRQWIGFDALVLSAAVHHKHPSTSLTSGLFSSGPRLPRRGTMAPGTGTPLGVLALTATFVAGTVGVTYWWLRKRFLKVARVKSIVIYPIKSIVGLEIPYAYCTIEGLVYGSIKDSGRVPRVLARRATLALIRLSHEEGKLTLTADAMDPLIVDAADPDAHSKTSFTVKLWGNDYRAVEVSPQASAWFNRYLKREDVRLVRILQDDQNIARGKNGTIPVAFHDTSTIHMLSVASLKDFNSKLPEGNVEITERTFRPSFLIEGCDAYAEIPG
ncbi:hypothetical protein HPB47_002290 [Ixodes persulcatus]|uniref:Uncharacterized protein n=1 Tax=Ixodes persulcatus TaxID=34615 RepID=A0AC60PN61_IXOPE|nr:hypothetical protein HPB47_002290 [Ixodes persulcatus]